MRQVEKTAYNGAKDRCNNPKNAKFHRYGGRGIEFRFASFEEFIQTLGPRPSKTHSLDRYPNNDGHYELGNVRWATYTDQNRNKSGRVMAKYNGTLRGLAEIAEDLAIPYGITYEILKRPCYACPPSEVITLCSHAVQTIREQHQIRGDRARAQAGEKQI